MPVSFLVVIAVLWTNALLLGILMLLWQVRKELKVMVRRVRVDTDLMTANTSELASAIRNGDREPVLAVTEEINAR